LHQLNLIYLYSLINSSLAFIWAFLISVFAIPSIVRVSHQKKILDEPNGRTIHLSSTPRLGGLAIFAGLLSSLTIFGNLANGIQYVLAGTSILFFIGLKDDIVTVSAFKKFFVQLLASSIILFIGNIRITSFQGMFGIYEIPDGMSYAFSLILIIGVTNAINLIDGLDGLSGTIIIIISATFGAFFFIYGGSAFGAYGDLAICLIGGVAGFLRYNMHKAIIFMGDAGSLVCGFIISVMAMKFIEMQPVHTTPTIALGILFIPLYDTLRVSISRIIKGKSPFSPDKNHIHHRFIAMGFSQIATVFMLALINISLILFVIFFEKMGMHFELMIIIIFSVILTVILEMIPRLKKVPA